MFVLLLIGMTAACIGMDVFIYRKWPCRCGRRKSFYFSTHHEKPMWWLVIIWALVSVVNLLAFDLFKLGVALLWLAYFSLRWYYHDKGKIKRAAKTLGRIIINEHGRLVVVHDKT